MIIEEDVYLEHTDPVNDFLVHFGVMGMRWGVRRDRRNRRLAEAGVKGGSKAAKIRALVTGKRFIGQLGPVDLIRGRGVTGAAARKSKRISDRTALIKSGKSHIWSKIAHYSGTRITDFIPVKEKNIYKKTFMDNHKLVIVGAGLMFVNSLLGAGTKLKDQ